MKKVVSKLIITALMVTMLAGCSKKNTTDDNKVTDPTGSPTTGANTDNNGASDDGVEKPKKITIMVNGTFYTEQNGQKEWVAKWEELTGIDLEVIQPDHTGYNDVLSQTLASGDWPDVVLLDSTYYSNYASEGVLWDMTDAWEASEVKNRLSASDNEVMNGMYLNGKIYGLTRTRGNGAVTYIKKAWLDKMNLSAPTNFAEYLEVCKAFTMGDPDGNGVDGDTYAVSAAGFLGLEAPYVNYLPEFYQEAYPTFYQKEDGTWVDGFTEDAMIGALARLKDAYDNGYIDPETLTNATSDVRNKFYENKTGIFTYWAGKWANNLKTNLEANSVDAELVAIPPIAEVGTYIDRSTGGYCITSAADNPEGVYKWLIETMFDGGEIQALWTYGVEGIHHSKAAETLLDVTYEEGQLHGLESRETPGTAYTFDATSLLIGVTDDFAVNYNAYEPDVSKESQLLFNSNSRGEDRIVSTEEMSKYNGDLTSLKREIIANVITQGKSIEDEMKRFETDGGLEWSQLIVDSLNSSK